MEGGEEQRFLKYNKSGTSNMIFFYKSITRYQHIYMHDYFKYRLTVGTEKK